MAVAAGTIVNSIYDAAATDRFNVFSEMNVEDISNAFSILKDQLGDSYDIIYEDNNSLKENLLNLANLDPALKDNIDAIIKNKEAFNNYSDFLIDK